MLVSLLFLVVAAASCNRSARPDPRVEQLLEQLDLNGRLAQLVMVTADAPTLLDADRAYASATLANGARIGGLWITGGEGWAVARLDSLRRADPRIRLLLAANIDQGIGATIAGGTVFPPVTRLIGMMDRSELRRVAATVAEEGSRIGLDLGLLYAPPTAAEERHKLSVDSVPERLLEYVEAASAAGTPTALQLFWNPGTPGDERNWDRARLELLEIPLLNAAREGAAALAPGGVVLPAVTGDSVPFALSAAAVRGLLRRDAGWDKLVITDLRDEQILAGIDPGAAAVRAVAAGSDLLVVAGGADETVAALLTAVNAAELSTDVVEAAVRRILQFKVERMDEAARVEQERARGEGIPLNPPFSKGDLSDTLSQGDLSLKGDVSDSLSSNADSVDTLRLVRADSVGMREARLVEADRAINRAIQRGTMEAAALAIGRHGRLVRFRGYGSIAAGEGPVDPESTLFDLASLTKIVGTTTAAAVLVEEGVMDLNAPIQRWVPEFRGEGKERVTLWHLLTHTSGLPPGLELYFRASSREQALRQVLRQPLRRPPGEAVEYSDLGMIVLSEVLERASGRPLDVLVAQRILSPLEMNSTMFLPPAVFRERIVPTALETERSFPIRGVVHDGNAFRLGGVTGHAGLFSTLSDIAVFTQLILNGGTYGGTRILADSTVRSFTSRQPRADERALGWDTPAEESSAGRYFSRRAFGHTGFTGTSIWIDPELDLFVVLLTNRTFTEGSADAILALRRAVHDAAALAINDRKVTRRPGAR